MSTIKIIVKEAIDTIEEMVPKVARGVAEKSTKLSTKTRQIKQQIEAKDAELAAGQKKPDKAPDHDAPARVTRNDGVPLVRGDDGYYYEPDGRRVPYSNSARRPDYADGQVQSVWDRDRATQAEYIARRGSLRPDANGFAPERVDADQLWVLDRDGNYQSVTWTPGDSRRPEVNPDGAWDMGHLTGGEFRDLHADYLRSGDKDGFLSAYRDPQNYEVQHPGRNRSHVDEG